VKMNLNDEDECKSELNGMKVSETYIDMTHKYLYVKMMRVKWRFRICGWKTQMNNIYFKNDYGTQRGKRRQLNIYVIELRVKILINLNREFIIQSEWRLNF
jgi:hypothetical protein